MSSNTKYCTQYNEPISEHCEGKVTISEHGGGKLTISEHGGGKLTY